MTLAEAIYQRSLRLPEEAAREALDFIEFLEQRYGTRNGTDASAADDAARRTALERVAGIRVDWGGKPIRDRNALYDAARDGS
ncbi:DUF2281 domain-containing protein [Thiohalocapsa sp. ML1]|jgi:hypothetical protein|uniref:DUF2281 domain-containing protein n=1 Tax=Thiohalocapsa sp. ML1 TaxID=1431688 RepID=UPI000732387C|nr:DUF2281 domain-containing protein [Thiohalocapsa sp. ML1]